MNYTGNINLLIKFFISIIGDFDYTINYIENVSQ